ncbi:hypothetical protein DXG03_008145 [Asterophora parasitica]|uniref:Protein-lysine N-methyltransferase EFM6 n=1 Tax=Asterophora parasitica TaxID=117018 RepID=A0A9P7G7C0_9AGAR|nr:hypothetical protein DXG03_008145 [Asterophora parasitica]
MTFHDDLALDERLDALDPLRHLMQQPSSSDTSEDEDESSRVQSAVESLIPKQRRSILNESLELSFSGLGEQEQHPIALSLAVDASPGCGGIAWPAGEVLSSYLAKRGPGYVRGRTILELGSGTGLVGLVAARLGCESVCITDQAPLLDIMRRNVRANALEESVSVAELNWGEPLPSDIGQAPDLILAADCVYFEPAFPLLVQTLAELVDLHSSSSSRPSSSPAYDSTRQELAPETETEILFCYKKRRKADKRFFSLLKKQFSWTEVEDDPDRAVYTREAISLLRLHRRGSGGGG